MSEEKREQGDSLIPLEVQEQTVLRFNQEIEESLLNYSVDHRCCPLCRCTTPIPINPIKWSQEFRSSETAYECPICKSTFILVEESIRIPKRVYLFKREDHRDGTIS